MIAVSGLGWAGGEFLSEQEVKCEFTLLQTQDNASSFGAFWPF